MIGLAIRDLPLPLMTLRESALAHNIALLQSWCDARGLSLAPHGKTSMAPQLIRRQLDAGAWGMTAATVQQVAVMREAGARRVILANEVVGAPEIALLERERARGVEIFVLVDSVEAVALLDAELSSPLPVLIELGGTRAGCRTEAEALAVADAVAAAPHLVLAGVEGFEGSVGSDRSPATVAAVDAFLDRIRSLIEALDARGAFAGVGEILATAGGSALFDRVAERLTFSRPVRVVLRSGCYVTTTTAPTAMSRRCAGSSGRRSSSGPASSPRPSRASRSRASESATRPTTSGSRSPTATATSRSSRSTTSTRSSAIRPPS